MDGWIKGEIMSIKNRIFFFLCKTVGEKKKYCKIPFQIPYGFVSTWIYMKAPCCATLLEGESTGGSYKYKGMWDTPAGVWRNIDNSLTTRSLFVFEWRKWRKHKALPLSPSLSLTNTQNYVALLCCRANQALLPQRWKRCCMEVCVFGLQYIFNSLKYRQHI